MVKVPKTEEDNIDYVIFADCYSAYYSADCCFADCSAGYCFVGCSVDYSYCCSFFSLPFGLIVACFSIKYTKPKEKISAPKKYFNAVLDVKLTISQRL